MAYYQVTSFYYDAESNNIFVQFATPVEVSYEYDAPAGGGPYDVYEAQIFLDAGTNIVGKYRPGSIDGTFTDKLYGRDSGSTPASTVTNPLEDAPQ